MRVLVTGGAGFIGSHVVDYLLTLGHEVLVIDNLFSGRDHWKEKAVRPRLLVADILDRSALSSAFRGHNPEAVFHLAAHHYIPFCDANPAAAYDLNVVGTLNVVHESSEAGVQKFFFASTADVYAPSPHPHKEDDAIGPFTTYGRTKLVGEIICRGVRDWRWHPNLVIGRLFNAVGTRETNPHLVPEIIGQIIRGSTQLHLGNLFPTRDFVDVATQARAIVDVTLAARGIDTVNIGSGKAVSAAQMVEMILAEAAVEIEVVIDPGKVRAAERTNLCAVIDRLAALIPTVPHPAGTLTIRSILEEATMQARSAHPKGVS